MERLFFPYTAKEAKKAGAENCAEMNRNSVFASRLRDLRNEYEMSQAALADALGIVKSTIGLYETGDTVPDARTIKKYAEFFGVSADWLLGLSECSSVDVNEKAAGEYLGVSLSFIRSLKDAQRSGAFACDEESKTYGGPSRLEMFLSVLVCDPSFVSDFAELCEVVAAAYSDTESEQSMLSGENSDDCDSLQFRRYMVQRGVMWAIDHDTGFRALENAQRNRLHQGWDRIGLMGSVDDAWRAGHGK